MYFAILLVPASRVLSSLKSFGLTAMSASLPIADEVSDEVTTEGEEEQGGQESSIGSPVWDHWEVRSHPSAGVPPWSSDAQHHFDCDCEECVTYFSQRALDLAPGLKSLG